MANKKVYKSSLGKVIDMDSIKAINEEVIAVGNMYVNARGDELGPGGKVVRSRNQVMKEYYSANGGGVATNDKDADVGSLPKKTTPKAPTVPIEKELPIAANHGARADMVRPEVIEDDSFMEPEESIDVNQRERAAAEQARIAERQASSDQAATVAASRPRFRGSLAEGVAMRGTKDVFQESAIDTKTTIKRI